MEQRSRWGAVAPALILLLLAVIAVKWASTLQEHPALSEIQGGNASQQTRNLALQNTFSEAADAHLERTAQLREMARTFDQKTALDGLGPSKLNGFYYLLDDHLADAVPHGTPGRIDAPDELLNLTFNGSYIVTSQDEEYTIENGSLSIPSSGSGYLEIALPADLNITADEIGEVEIIARNERGTVIRFGWSDDPEANFTWWETSLITINAIPDGRTHTYTINNRNSFDEHPNSVTQIRKLFIDPSNEKGDDVAIEGIRIVSKTHFFNEAPYGATYGRSRGTMREGIYMRSPMQLTYNISLPKDRATIEFGIGILMEGPPVRFIAQVTGNNGTRTIFNRSSYKTFQYENGKISLSKWAGQDVQLTLSVESNGSNIGFWGAPTVYVPPKDRFNVIVILQDALRADHMSVYGYERDTTPAEDEFAGKGAVFLNSYSQETVTKLSCPTIMTSLYPSATGVWKDGEYLNERYLTLAEIMRSQGFETFSFVQNPFAGDFLGLHQGFGKLIVNVRGNNGMHPSENIASNVASWIEDNRDRNFFVYMHMMDPHAMYNPPEDFRQWYYEVGGENATDTVKRNNWLDPAWVTNPSKSGRIALYDGEIANNNRYIDIFLKNLSDSGLMNDTLVIFIADHGEYFGEHNQWEHGSPGHVQGIHTPLIMVYPKGIPAGEVLRSPVQNIDVMPTILELAGINMSGLLIEGDSLLPLMKSGNDSEWAGRIAISEDVRFEQRSNPTGWGSVFYNGTHMLYSPTANLRVYDLAADPSEDAGADPDAKQAREYSALMGQLQDDNIVIWKSITGSEQTETISNPDQANQLRALGYLN